jgi:predicted phosphodiesterase
VDGLRYSLKVQPHEKSYKIHYFHGSGGGGPVTRGVIQNQRKMADIEGADCIWMGHVHELYAMYQTKATLDGRRYPIIKGRSAPTNWNV